MFHKGQRVRLTSHGESARILQSRACGRGTVVAYNNDDHSPLCVIVLPDGYKHPRHYSVNFWEAAQRAGKVE